MSDYFVMFLCLICWGMGFMCSWLYSTIKLKKLVESNENLHHALSCAGDTILEQNNEICSILQKAATCESGIIN